MFNDSVSEYRPIIYEEISNPMWAIPVLLGEKFIDWLPLSKSLLSMEITRFDWN